MMRRVGSLATAPVVMLLAVLLSGCGSQQASYQITDRNHSLSVMREQRYPGSDWENDVIIARYPECQRRYPLRKSSDGFKLDVYRVDPGVFIFNQGKRWYVGETKNCQWQQYPEPPPEPGVLIGTFQTKADELVWIDKEPKKDKDAAEAPAKDGASSKK